MFKLGHYFASDCLKSVLDLTERVAVNSRRFRFTLKPQVETMTTFLTVRNSQIGLHLTAVKSFHRSAEKSARKKRLVTEDDDDEEKSLVYFSEFQKQEEKNKKTFLERVRLYKKHIPSRAGHADFIKAALKSMKSHGVHRDLECYKKILDVLPKGVYVAKNKWMAAGMYFPRQQYAVLDLLDEMGKNGVLPDAELGFMLINIFGRRSYASEKFEQMLYWSLKWKNKSPFLLPRPLPSDPLLLAKLAIERITSVDPQTEVSVYETDKIKDSIDKTWIVSGQSPKQRKLLKKHSHNSPVIVEGGSLVWLREKCISYFILKADGNPLPFVYPEDTNDISNLKSKFFNPNYVEKEESPTVHEQDDGIIYAVCATGTSSKDSLLSWVRILESVGNVTLADVPVLFRFSEKEKLPANFGEDIVPVNEK